MFYQRRRDRRLMIFIQENILGAGTLHAQFIQNGGHVILAGKGTYDATIAAGTIRLIALLDMTINPSRPLPAAKDVLLVQ